MIKNTRFTPASDIDEALKIAREKCGSKNPEDHDHAAGGQHVSDSEKTVRNGDDAGHRHPDFGAYRRRGRHRSDPLRHRGLPESRSGADHAAGRRRALRGLRPDRHDPRPPEQGHLAAFFVALGVLALVNYLLWLSTYLPNSCSGGRPDGHRAYPLRPLRLLFTGFCGCTRRHCGRWPDPGLPPALFPASSGGD